ncbi:hypothetical protein GCM10009662_69530 [Catellatospora coxensis]|uniref:Uncharacterized protein n=1 Tax=Catellatospora coxensis TaxID=310354 RepID=A0A8J3KUC3_9ACTN|nr:hypothetical protein Cco03nite_59370 [Catellatospora coxensis]
MEYELCLRLWQEEREQIRHRLRLAVTWSATCLAAAVVLCGLLLVAEAAEPTRLSSAADGASALAGVILALIGGLGVAVVMVVRSEVETHRRRAEALFAEFALPAEDRARLPQGNRGVYNTADGEVMLTAPLLAAHWATVIGGVVALFAGAA